MIEERAIKTHLIVTDIHEEYSINWCGKIIDAKPLLVNGLPLFIIIGSTKRIELNTANIKRIEECAKHITEPHGRAARTTDKAYIYLRETSGKDFLLGIVTHNHIKTYAQMFDKVGFR